MKKVFFTIALVFMAFVAKAEEFKAFRVDLGLGYTIPTGGNGGGVLMSFEPKYAINPNIAVGIRAEFAGMAKVKWDLDPSGAFVDNGDVEVKFTGSYLLTGDYYFTTNNFRPFGGLGLGTYSIAGASMNTLSDETNIGNTTNFGFMLRGGFDVSHFRLALEYNFAGKDNFNKSCSYLGIKANVYIGGGRK